MTHETQVSNVSKQEFEEAKERNKAFESKEILNQSNTIEKEFKVQRMSNGMGHSHLLVITEEAVEDMEIGTVVIIPYAEGFKDPVKVRLQVNEKGLPKRANGKFGIVNEYIYK